MQLETFRIKTILMQDLSTTEPKPKTSRTSVDEHRQFVPSHIVLSSPHCPPRPRNRVIFGAQIGPTSVMLSSVHTWLHGFGTCLRKLCFFSCAKDPSNHRENTPLERTRDKQLCTWRKRDAGDATTRGSGPRDELLPQAFQNPLVVHMRDNEPDVYVRRLISYCPFLVSDWPTPSPHKSFQRAYGQKKPCKPSSPSEYHHSAPTLFHHPKKFFSKQNQSWREYDRTQKGKCAHKAKK